MWIWCEGVTPLVESIALVAALGHALGIVAPHSSRLFAHRRLRGVTGTGNVQLALEKAKEATKAERLLVKHRETSQIADGINNDLTYAVLFTLASMYHKSGMHTEALATYTMIVRNKQYAMSGRLRVNMGNIYFEQKKYPSAIKMYRMALDQIPNTNRDVRYVRVCVAHVVVMVGVWVLWLCEGSVRE